MEQAFTPGQQMVVDFSKRYPPFGKPDKASTVLMRMYAKLREESAWCQCDYVMPSVGHDFAFCIVGAWQYSIGGDAHENALALLAIYDLLPDDKMRDHRRITQWNDRRGRTHQEVLELLKSAIAKFAPEEIAA